MSSGTFDIDGTTLNYIGQAVWSQPQVETSLDLIAVHNRHQVHTWSANVMSASEWATLIGKRGSLVSITTTDADDEDGSFVTYYNVRVDDVSARAHDSLNVVGVQVRFLVLV